MLQPLFKAFTAFALMLYVSSAQAVLTINIEEGYDNALPIALVPLAAEPGLDVPQDLAQIVADNLNRSGHFKPVSRSLLPAKPSEMEQIDYNQWRILGTDYMLIGKVGRSEPGHFMVDMKFVDVLRKQVLVNKRWNKVRPDQLRRTAHVMSDAIYQSIMGVRGAFSTQIAYVTLQKQGKQRLYTLEVADADGFNSQSILRSYEPIMSPSWSPDGKTLAYVSFENQRPEIFVQSVYGTYRKKIAGFKGINSAPAWSPDGTKLAMTLSKDGNADIYIMEMATGRLQKVTSNRAIETEAAWSPDGTKLYFSSDRRGQPQVFKLNLNTMKVDRMTYEGKYNSNVDVSPDGRTLAIVHNRGEGFHIALMDLVSGDFTSMTDTFLDESPSFSPNGEMILYAMNKNDRGQLAVIDKEGKASQVLQVINAEVREPAWGPYLD